MYLRDMNLRKISLFIVSVIVLYTVIWYVIAEYVIKGYLSQKSDNLIHSIKDFDISCRNTSIGGYPFKFLIHCEKPEVKLENYQFNSDQLLDIQISVLFNKFCLILPHETQVLFKENNVITKKSLLTLSKNREMVFRLQKSIFKSLEPTDSYGNLSKIRKIKINLSPVDLQMQSGMFLSKFDSKSEYLKFILEVSQSEDALEVNSVIDILGFTVKTPFFDIVRPVQFTILNDTIINKSGYIDIQKTRINADKFLKASIKGSGSVVDNNFDLLLQIYDVSTFTSYLQTTFGTYGQMIGNTLINSSDVYNQEENRLSYRILFNNNQVKIGAFK